MTEHERLEIFCGVFMSAIESGCSELEAAFLAREGLAEVVAFYGRVGWDN